MRGGWMVRLFGYSPTSGHAEPSWAADLPLDEGCNIGQRFRQDAIYHVKNDELSVTRCDESRATSARRIFQASARRKVIDRLYVLGAFSISRAFAAIRGLSHGRHRTGGGELPWIVIHKPRT